MPVVATLVCDDLTPVSAFARLAGASPRAFLLESVVGGERVARYSFVGFHPSRTLKGTRHQLVDIDHIRGEAQVRETHDPLLDLEELLTTFNAAPHAGLPRFCGGAVGFAGYDLARYYERLPHAPSDDRGLPDLMFDLYELLVVFDHAYKRVHLVAHARIEDKHEFALRGAYREAGARLAAIADRLAEPYSLPPVSIPSPPPEVQEYSSNYAPGAFESAISAAKEYIRAGDIFQVVLSQRLHMFTSASAFDIYRAARVINPSPFMFFLKSPELCLVGASPEIMCRVVDRMVTNRPLAGTRPRGESEEADRRLRDELLADAKERAEHVMLVDLGRNDLGRVCESGSVRLGELMSIEAYSHVMHISSTVTGTLEADCSAFDALRATLPVGTVSGAPKIRAMEIIDEFEPTRRGPYAGAVGYFDFAGNMDTCIALRTVVLTPAPDGRTNAFVQVGAGIVADSQPGRECQETINKARGMLTAIRVAELCFSSRAAAEEIVGI